MPCHRSQVEAKWRWFCGKTTASRCTRVAAGKQSINTHVIWYTRSKKHDKMVFVGRSEPSGQERNEVSIPNRSFPLNNGPLVSSLMCLSENRPIEVCLAIDIGWRPSVGGFVAKSRLLGCTRVAAGKQSIIIYVIYYTWSKNHEKIAFVGCDEPTPA